MYFALFSLPLQSIMIKTLTIALVMFCLQPFVGRVQVIEKGEVLDDVQRAQDSGQQFQTFELKHENDSLYWLVITGGDKANGWRLAYPVYQFQTGDVDGDGSEDAMVGVIKGTRFYPQKARRLFIFKQIDGTNKKGEPCKKVRPMWLGSKLGGILEDFRYIAPADEADTAHTPDSADRLKGGRIRALESTTDSLYVVSDYKWSGFGMKFDRHIIKGVDKETATKYLNQ